MPIDDILAHCEFPADGVGAMLAPAVAAGTSIKDYCQDYARKPRGLNIFVGAPEQLADHMET